MRPPAPPAFKSYKDYIDEKYRIYLKINYSKLLKDSYEEILKYLHFPNNFLFHNFIEIVLDKKRGDSVSIYHHYIYEKFGIHSDFIKMEIVFNKHVFFVFLIDSFYITKEYRNKINNYNPIDITIGDEILYFNEKHFYLGKFTEKTRFLEYYFFLVDGSLFRIQYQEELSLYDTLFDNTVLDHIISKNKIKDINVFDKNKKYISINDNFNNFLNDDYVLDPKEVIQLEIDKLSEELFS